jgi:hypothetical protein
MLGKKGWSGALSAYKSISKAGIFIKAYRLSGCSFEIVITKEKMS